MKIQKKCSRPYKIRVCPRLQSGGNSLFLSGSLISHRTAAEMRLKPAYNTDESIYRITLLQRHQPEQRVEHSTVNRTEITV